MQPTTNKEFSGLNSKEVADRQKTIGLNELKYKKKSGPMAVFFGQFKDVLVLILLACTVISVFVGEITDAITIMLIVLLNAVLGFVQEYRTEKTFEKLKAMSAPMAKVYRNNTLTTIPAKELVPDDIISVELGDVVPADACLLEQKNLYADEAVLTGESLPTSKSVGDKNDKLNTLNKPNIIYSGTNITKGKAVAKIIATGTNTQMGKISEMLSNIDSEQTPLQRKLAELGKVIGIVCLVICGVIALAGLLRGFAFFDMFMTAITVAVAAVPEGLPATVTIALALAVGRMFRQNALVRKLHSVETLGCASIICSDKTGTLTEGKMSVKEIESFDNDYKDLLECAVICNNSTLDSGDPTEIALVKAADKRGITPARLAYKYEKTDEIPFDSNNKYMSVTARDSTGRTFDFVKGAPDVLLNMCDIDHNYRKKIEKAIDSMSRKALRVLAFSKNRKFLGIIGLLDPPRKGVKEAIRKCRTAGIRTVMLTGDHKNTAVAIAKEIGLLQGKKAITGAELDAISDKELAEKINDYAVYARISPEHKLRLVKAYKQKGYITAMTGDGANDAPAIKEADIGVAMGITGTDVTKETADIVLMDDNFTTLVQAVEQGRTVYSNVRKFVRYLLSCNIGEVLTVFLAIIMGLPLVLLPVQLLLVNLVTDGLPALALSLEPPSKEAMKTPPRMKNDSFFSGGLFGTILFRGIMIGLCTLGCFTTILRMGLSIDIARTAALLTLVLSQLIHVFECKSERGNIFTVSYFNNGFLLFAVLFSAAVMFGCIYFAPLAGIFGSVALTYRQLVTAVVFAVIVPIASTLTLSTRPRVAQPRHSNH
jgi:Ca2+-transporting ATPase